MIPAFLADALAALAVLSVAGALVGVQLNLRGLEFFGDGLVHSIFPGVVIGFVLAGTQGILLGGGIAALLATILLTMLARRGLGDDAATAVVLSGAFSIGVVVVSTTRQYTGGLEHLLFGQLLVVDAGELAAVAVLCALAVGIVAATWRSQVLISFDRAAARAMGLRVGAHEFALNVAIALVVVAGSRAIGNLLVLALLIVPPAIGRLASRRLALIVPIAVLASLAASLGGLLLAFRLSVSGVANVSPSGVVVLAITGVYLAAALARSLADGMRGARRGDALPARRPARLAAALRDEPLERAPRSRQARASS